MRKHGFARRNIRDAVSYTEPSGNMTARAESGQKSREAETMRKKIRHLTACLAAGVLVAVAPLSGGCSQGTPPAAESTAPAAAETVPAEQAGLLLRAGLRKHDASLPDPADGDFRRHRADRQSAAPDREWRGRLRTGDYVCIPRLGGFCRGRASPCDCHTACGRSAGADVAFRGGGAVLSPDANRCAAESCPVMPMLCKTREKRKEDAV